MRVSGKTNVLATLAMTASIAMAAVASPKAAVAQPIHWDPPADMTWEIQISSTPKGLKDVDAYDVDLFETPQDKLDEIEAKGINTICYFSAGSYEQWRDDAEQLAPHRGKKLKGWKGEWWIDIREDEVRNVMKVRLDEAAAKGCDAVDPDNVDAYQNKNGLGLTPDDQVDYLLFLAAEAHQRGMAIGLKNSVELIPRVLNEFDFTVNEECFDYKECGDLTPFIEADKPVLQIQYGDKAKDRKKVAKKWCGKANDMGFSTLIKGWDLDAKGIDCQNR